MQEGTTGEVLYEIRRHARRSLSIDPSCPDQTGEASNGRGLLSYLSLQGVSRLKERWNEYNRQRPFKRRMSLFVSPNGEHLAVAAGNQIVILHRGDDYMEPCGVFTNNDRLPIFTNGAWLEPQGILGVVDDMSNIYFIKATGEEITRRTRKQLKLSAPIIDMIVQDNNSDTDKLSLSGFCIFTTDGSAHQIDATQELDQCIHPIPTSSNHMTKNGQFPRTVSCVDFHPDLSLVVLVGDSNVSLSSKDYSGASFVYLFHITPNSELNLMFCGPELKGLFLSPKGHRGPFASPKVTISPQGKHLAVLDLIGNIDVLKLDGELYSLSFYSFPDKQFAHMPNNSILEKKNLLADNVDVSWWTDRILVLAKKSGSVIMYDIINGTSISVSDPIFSMPIIERAKHRQGFIFVLEATTSEEMENVGNNIEHIQPVSFGNYIPPTPGRYSWNLISFTEASISGMYTILINNKKYQDALGFASRYDLNTDEVFKAQWLHSDQCIAEIDLYLSKVKDQTFVLSECVNRVAPTEAVLKALISYGLRITDQYKFSDSDDKIQSSIWEFRMLRLQLLQYRDWLETFLGINMGRFSPQEYTKFRSTPLTETALVLAESGKIGALNLLFKRHPYTVSPSVLNILSSIPETVPVQSYSQLLPGKSPPGTVVFRDGDWVECENMVSFINKLPNISEKIYQIKTENILKYSVGFVWPSVTELSNWYMGRAREIDNLSGQLDNCLSLVEFAYQKGIMQLRQFRDDISYLHQLIYSDESVDDFTMNLVTWEQLPDYEKFKILLNGFKEDMIVQRLRENAIPFMQKRYSGSLDFGDGHNETFVVRWLKEIASQNQLAMCFAVIENGCGDSPVDGLFKDEVEIIETALQCIYLCSATDQWNMMASILSKLPRITLTEKFFDANEDSVPKYATQGFGTPKILNANIQHEKSEMLASPINSHNGNFVVDDSGESANQLDIGVTIDQLTKRIRVAEGHVDVGRLLAYYQVPKPLNFFLGSQSDEKNVKQLLRLVLSKFGRRQPRSDNDWANMWRDMQCFQEKAFPFLDSEYMLTEFIRGLLKAGKISLARNYLRGTSSITLGTEKAENLVIQAAREYFFSASSLSCNEIWKAKECLSLFPNSSAVQAESDIIDALTIRLPAFGVTILPMQFRQIRNPMEIINMVITSQSGAYLIIEELIEIAKLLGLKSEDDIAAVEEAVAREAAVAGDLQLAFDLCLVLVKKDHGAIWDLCAAIARGPHLDNMETSARKQLIGFALSHCDEESIGELLNAWKEVDIRDHFEKLMTSTGMSPPNFSVQGSSIISLPTHSVQDIFDLRDSSELLRHGSYNKSGKNVQNHFSIVKELLSKIATDLPTENEDIWESFLRENKKILSFAALELPWLLELCENREYGKKNIATEKIPSRRYCISERLQATVGILYWLAVNGIAPKDDLIISLAKSIMESPVTEEDDVLGCSFLLNLMDPFHGVEIIEEELKRREVYQEIYSIMNVGMGYSSLNNAQKGCSTPDQRRNLLLHKFHEKLASYSSVDEVDHMNQVQNTFWKEWKTKLELQKQLADQARALEQVMPGTETARFLSGDIDYIRSSVFSFIDSVKLEKKHILKEAVKLADTYGFQRTEVLLRFFSCALVSELWENHEILAEISEFREDIVKCAKGVINMISLSVFPEIDGHNKQRLSYIYSILSACFLRLGRMEDPEFLTYLDRGRTYSVETFQFYKVLEQECQRTTFIDGLNFKNIAGLDDLNFEHFNEEICKNIYESTVEALADMVQALVGLYYDSQSKGLISREGVYKHHVLSLLASLEGRNEARSNSITPDELHALIGAIELNYNGCKKYVGVLSESDISYIIGRYCTLCFPSNFSRTLPHEPAWRDCLNVLITFWMKLLEDIPAESGTNQPFEKTVLFDTNGLLSCLKVFKILVMDEKISINQGWKVVSNYVKRGLVNGLSTDVSSFCSAMIFSGCAFELIVEAYNGALHPEISSTETAKPVDLLELYSDMTDTYLSDIIGESKEHQCFHNLLSSLSKLAYNYLEDLKKIRTEIWEKLNNFSENMQLESQVRVYALQLMQSITGRNLKSLPPELVTEVEPWESWDEPSCAGTTISAEGAAVSSNVTSSLVALKSSQLVAHISPSIKITGEHLMNLDSAVSCFLHLSESVSSIENLNVLKAVLEEWEQLFFNKINQDQSQELSQESNNWSSDEWDEGWETFPEDILTTGPKQDESISVHPLHSCWMEIIRKLIELSNLRTVMELLDQSLAKSCILLDEDEAQYLFQLVTGMDSLMVLKLFLLLPYKGPRSEILHVVENKLIEGSISGTSNPDDYELLALILSSGVLHDIASDQSYCKVSSYMCYLVGHLARISQQDILRHWKGEGRRQKRALLFGRVLLPCFISELVLDGNYLLAGFIISQWMHTHPSLGLIDIVEASLRRFLQGQLLQLQHPECGVDSIEVDPCTSICCTISTLKGKLITLLQSALSTLPDDSPK
ncbi:MAG2-interacting protein 2 isoform X1 [Typha angustifolia]|uniref:MAG2-interacting protein 2 isoform X1 n=2 Tax=Typha angustifolia TaxID=59011 RepID=UPI003C2D1B1A